MEKDYFLDRPKASTIYHEVYVGDAVFICEKAMQKTAKTIDDLTFGWIKRKLSHDNHPRGIKVEILKENGETAIGRIVYTVKDKNIVTIDDEKKEKENKTISTKKVELPKPTTPIKNIPENTKNTHEQKKQENIKKQSTEENKTYTPKAQTGYSPKKSYSPKENYSQKQNNAQKNNYQEKNKNTHKENDFNKKKVEETVASKTASLYKRKKTE